MLVKVLAFTSVYFFESGLFNGLRAFGVKNFRPLASSRPAVAAGVAPFFALPPCSIHRNKVTVISDFCNKKRDFPVAQVFGFASWSEQGCMAGASPHATCLDGEAFHSQSGHPHIAITFCVCCWAYPFASGLNRAGAYSRGWPGQARPGRLSGSESVHS
jgi:hypothetical protein